MLLRAVQPETPGHVQPLERPVVKSEERHQALGAERDPDGLAVAAELEPSQELEAERRARQAVRRGASGSRSND
jgi:hypothetical protein